MCHHVLRGITTETNFDLILSFAGADLDRVIRFGKPGQIL